MVYHLRLRVFENHAKRKITISLLEISKFVCKHANELRFQVFDTLQHQNVSVAYAFISNTDNDAGGWYEVMNILDYSKPTLYALIIVV